MATLPVQYDAADVETAMKKYVDALMAGGLAIHRTEIQGQLDQAAVFIKQCGEHAEAARQRAEEAGTLGQDAQGRIHDQVTGLNEVKAFIDSMMPKLKQMEADQHSLHAQMMQAKLDIEGQHTLLEQTTQVGLDRVNTDLLKWTTDFKKDVQAEIGKLGSSAGGLSFGGGGGRGRGEKSSLDKKELAVWKLPEDVDKMSFRHWVDAVDVQLAMVHDCRYASYVLAQVRRSKIAIDREVLDACCAAATVDIDRYRQESKMGADPLGGVTEDADYPFMEKSQFLHSYLISKISASLHEKTVGIEHKHGFEFYRQICQSVDSVPDNAGFHMRNDITGLTKTFGAKVSDLKSLYGFRLLLKKKLTEYKKIIGEEFDKEQAYQILWNAMDPKSTEQAMAEGLDKADYKKLGEHIDNRHKIFFGHLDYKGAKDDPMGLALVGEAHAPQRQEPEGSPSEQPGPQQERYDMDAFGKAKGKGKGDGKCHVCGGDGHFARDCPSVPPLGPMSQECHGCSGRGHVKSQCPTANPHLKGGKGGGGWDKGKGKCGWQNKGGGKGKGLGMDSWGKSGGKGKGYGKGKGVYGLDIMGSWGGNEWDGGGYGDWTPQVGSLDYGPAYGRQLNALSVAPIKTSSRYAAIAEVPETPPPPTAVNIDINDLIVRKPRSKLRGMKVKTPAKLMPYDYHGDECSCCPRAAPPSTTGIADVVSKVTFYENSVNDDEWDSEIEMSDVGEFPGDFFEDIDAPEKEKWTTVVKGRRGGKADTGTLPLKTASDSPLGHGRSTPLTTS